MYHKYTETPDKKAEAQKLKVNGLSIKDLKTMLDDADIETSEAEISMVFGMSKQTVINDNDEKG